MVKKIIFYLIGTSIFILILSNISSLSIFGIGTSSYTTTKSCDKFMKDIGNSDKEIPFTWQYTSTQFRCIDNYSDYKQPRGLGCKIYYSKNYCSTDIIQDNYQTTYSKPGVDCPEWIKKEKKNIVGSCWKKLSQIVSIESAVDTTVINNQFKCAIKYKSGCSTIPQCELVYGSGSSSNRNIIITTDKTNEQLSLFTLGQTIQSLKTAYPFSDYSEHFNIYRITDITLFNNSRDWSNRINEVTSICGISNNNRDVIIPSQKKYTYCPLGVGAKGCHYYKSVCRYAVCHSSEDFDLVSIVEVSQDSAPRTYAHELMHSGGAIGESYGENPQMFTDTSVNNVINWILK
jgi:hypothetical protein